ncbi:hypothetical protein POM88_021718 [Heracleum sosnowskyi]|uniref:DC1 domain-containing protein n=1 Tax=Heracleum sosnowskyi TaxID=360622 RepID=A0AAD8IGE9_9APIA|nr:hypothetical protein POM88_021718 [Heracleum sosnowskyi]
MDKNGSYGRCDGELYRHWSHDIKDHGLRFYVVPPERYVCKVCNMPGDLEEPCFKCPFEKCNYSIHKICCIKKPGSTTSHQFFDCKFTFHHNPAPNRGDVYCDACGVDISGYSYSCDCPDDCHDLHPTCAHIPIDRKRKTEKGTVLELIKKDDSKCLLCRKKYPVESCVRFTGWKWVARKRYRGFPFCFFGRKICYHLQCMKKIETLRL